MKITFTNQYINDFRALSYDEKEAVVAILELFQDDPLHASLQNHALEGRLKGRRAIAVDDDLRIVFRDHKNHSEVTLIAVGSHQRVYRR
ncbi:MAG: type II toxin-antitoxin system mRNA interferase toxin, RelE/StbE family [Alphaproteobacteria bacterium]|nr:type II toxin-antitoxin system mRNA interferase toxin, RelE/StbE family [Alphaproteobacteria bacterium]